MLASCSGGSSGAVGTANFDCGSGNETVICLESCNLGCSTTGCAQSDIAQNQIIILTFSEALDPNSVNSSSIRFRTPTGDEPVGEYFVNGRIVEYVPNLSIQGGQTFFGFTNGETYTMTILGGDDQAEVVRGTSGRPFGRTLTCTLQSTKGIVDLNQVPPSATLAVPTTQQLGSAPLDTEIVIEFNELIDATPFLSGTQSPVNFAVRRTRENGIGGFECNPESQPQTLSGTQSLSYDPARGVSVLTFVPSQALPGNVCIEVSVTDGVTDLSGRPAEPQVFVFQTVVVPQQEFTIVEDFDDNLQFDDESSAGTWGGANQEVTFAKIGGDGRHGEFNLSLAFDTETFIDGKKVYELDCDNTVIPPSNTTTGSAIPITDGRFFFSRFVVPADVRLRFVGSTPPVVTVAGRLDIQGVVDVVGKSVINSQVASAAIGQPGAEGGVFGGDGGQGGDKCLGTGPGTGQFNGRNGGTVGVLSNHAYLGSVGATSGKGSPLYPASGLDADQQYGITPTPTSGLYYCLSATAGGSGGGFYTAGTQGRVTGVYSGSNPLPNQNSFMGDPAPGGSMFQLFPFPPATGLQRSSQHFLVGGSGGGGAGSNTTLSLSLAKSWSSGAGGGGGGGAIALRSGRTLRVAQTGSVLAHGGSAFDYIGTGASAQVAPGGGGSGGSIVLQSGGLAEIDGLIDVRGGEGGDFDRSSSGGGIGPQGGRATIEGGDGGSGFVRLELATAPPVTELATMQPAANADNVGTLTEVDDLIAVRSTYYSTGLIFGPSFARYEIEAVLDGVPITFSDDPAFGVEAAVGQGLRVLFQAVNLDLSTGEVLETRPWRTSVRSSPTQTGISSDGLNGYRFMLLMDRQVATDLVVKSVTVVYLN